MPKGRGKRLFIAAALAALGLMGAGCGGAPKAKVVSLIANDILWDPAIIEAQVGQEIQLTLRNDGALDHNFVSEELEIDLLLLPGESKMVSFVVSEAGTLIFICDFPGHEEAGMVGEIVVR